jgi:hypothetical protein
MDAAEVGFYSALVVETSKIDESVGRFINDANRNPATILSHMPGCSAQSGVDCNCTFARMKFNDWCALDAAAHFGLEGLATTPAIPFELSERENKVKYYQTYHPSSGSSQQEIGLAQHHFQNQHLPNNQHLILCRRSQRSAA